MVSTKQKNVRLLPVSVYTPSFSYKKTLVLNLFSVLVLVLIYNLFVHKTDLAFFPNRTEVVFFTDKADQGESIINQTIQSDDAVGITCTLKKGFMFPYAGFELRAPYENELDVTDYDKVTVEVSSDNIQHMSMYLLFKDPALKNTQHGLALRRASSDLHLEQSRQTLTLDLSSFSTPNWWYSAVGQAKTDFSAPKLDKLRGLIFSTGINPALEESCSFTVNRITFHKDHFWPIFTLVLVQIAVLLVTVYLYFFRKGPTSKDPVSIKVHYKAVDIPQQFDTNNDKFLAYIHHNFADAELTLSQISKNTGMSEKNISQTIAERFDCNLKTYINKIRIAESKRLLLESKLSISEIAYKTGFNSPANFNRVFKSLTDESPTEYLQRQMPK